MPEQKKPTVLQRQQQSKPVIDDFIDAYLDEDLRKTAMEFVAWLRESKLQPRWGGKINTWEAYCKSKSICTIRIDPWVTEGHHRGYYDSRPGGLPCLVIIPRLANMETYKEAIMNEGLQDIIWNNANACVYSERSPSFGMKKAPGCKPGKPCAPGRPLTILGKEIRDNCCGYFSLQFWNPDDATVNSVKRLLELEQQARKVK